MILDTRTLFTLTFFQALMMGVCLVVTARKDYPLPVQKSMRLWGLSYLIQAAGWFLMGLRGNIPDFLSIVIANSLLLWSQAELFHSIRIFYGQITCTWRSYSLVLFIFIACWISLYVPNSYPARIVIVSFVNVVFFVMSGWQFINPKINKPSKIRRILGAGFWLLAIVYSLRIILTIGPEATPPSLLANSPLQTLVFGGTTINVMLVSIGFLLMCTENFNDLLLRLAITDDLTGIHNHRGIETITRQNMEQAKQSGQPLAFLIIDADNFKAINDTYGHLAGDVALKTIADTLGKNVRAAEFVGRLGGDEFVVVLPNTPEDTARQIAERLSSAVSETPIYFDGNRIKLGISFGITTYSAGEQDFEHLVRTADVALYEMKRNQKEQDAKQKKLTCGSD